LVDLDSKLVDEIRFFYVASKLLHQLDSFWFATLDTSTFHFVSMDELERVFELDLLRLLNSRDWNRKGRYLQKATYAGM
jgi:hypothetical protein